MRILTVNSSPRGDGQNKTELILNQIVEGMGDAGAQIDVVNLRKKKSKSASVVLRAGRRPPAGVFTKTI